MIDIGDKHDPWKSFGYGNTGCGVFKWGKGGTILEKILPKNQQTQRKLLNFENWVSKIWHYFRKQSDLKN